MSSSSESIYSEYIQLTKQYQTKYGKNAIVLLQVGAFFEVYGFRSAVTKQIQDSNIQEFSQICNLNMSEKKMIYEGRQVLMAGFRDYSLDKYLQKLTESGYTVAVFVQEKEGKNISRVLDSIHSSGTYVSNESVGLTNNIACIWIDIHKPVLRGGNARMNETIICGIAIANIYTGKSFLNEFQQPFSLQPTTFDDLERMISIYLPSEVIFISSLNSHDNQKILQYSGILEQGPAIHYVNNAENEKALRCNQQIYIRHILSTFFGEETTRICQEFIMYPTATQAFCYLLDFVQEHNPNLVRNISIPDFYKQTRVLLANHTLKQLNILDTTSSSNTNKSISSVCAFLNKCCSPMGKRDFHSRLVSPTTDEEWLNREYAITRTLLQGGVYDMVKPFRRILGQICDIEKIARQLVMRKLYPSQMQQLYESIRFTQQIGVCLAEHPEINDYLSNGADIEKICKQTIDFLDNHLYIERCKTIHSNQSFSENIVKPGICVELDAALAEYEQNTRIFNHIFTKLNEAIRENEKITNQDIEYVKIHETEKSGLSLQITKKRGAILKKMSAARGFETIVDGASWNELNLVSASSTTDEIEIPLLSRICKELINQKDTLNRWVMLAYVEVLANFEKDFYEILETLAGYIAKLDCLQCKAYIAKEYGYCCPEIVVSSDESAKSFVEAKNLRHTLIEHIQQNETYVANDISLGLETDGVLLYGTNAVGKTSLIRALGIAVIMAQAGLFVPCSSFRYKPYTAIFSRILGNDNLFKGLSTFAVEMSELRIILKAADKNSLILGDELCSGTETESALSIFVAGLLNLHSKNTSFIFATHFHEIVKYEEIRDLNRLALKHMAVYYDREHDTLIYNRKLLDGPGNRMYGLEVCKSLHLADDFLERAYLIRAKYFPDTKGELSHPPSKYNTAKIRGKCEMCGEEVASETHHIEPQKNADSLGFITTANNDVIHKNHAGNLMALCESCHLKTHKPKKTAERKQRK